MIFQLHQHPWISNLNVYSVLDYVKWSLIPKILIGGDEFYCVELRIDLRQWGSRILQAYGLKDDEMALQVEVRILGAVSDLHATDAWYHLD